MKLNPRVGGPHALSRPAFWVVLVTSVAINLPDPYTTWSLGTAWRNLLCAVIAVSAMFGVMWALRALVLPDAAERSHPWRAIAVFAVGATVRGALLAALLPAFGVGEGRFAYRVVTSIVVLVPLLAISAGLVDFVRQSAARRAFLQAEAVELIAQERDAAARTAAMQESAVAEVRVLLVQRLEDVRGDMAGDLAAELRHDVDDVIRPMSHRLFAGDAVALPTVFDVPAVRVRWSDVWRSASLGAPFRPIAMAAFLAVGSINANITYNGSALLGLALTAVQWLFVFAVFAGAARVLTDPMRRLRVGPRTAVLALASVGGPALAGLLFAAITIAADGASAWRIPLAMMFFGPLLVWVLAIEQGFRRQVTAADAQQAAANAGLRVAAALAGSTRRHEERRLSRALHGPIQTAVTAAAMHIAAGDEAEAEAMLLDAIGQLDPDAHESAPVAAALAAVVALWDGLCTLRAELAPGLDVAIDAHPATAGAFVDICIEACSNAVRHGGASHVTVDAHREGDAVLLEVRDDGAPAGPESPGGLGSALLDDVALHWERYRDGDQTVMRATLPLAT